MLTTVLVALATAFFLAAFDRQLADATDTIQWGCNTSIHDEQCGNYIPDVANDMGNCPVGG